MLTLGRVRNRISVYFFRHFLFIYFFQHTQLSFHQNRKESVDLIVDFIFFPTECFLKAQSHVEIETATPKIQLLSTPAFWFYLFFSYIYFLDLFKQVGTLGKVEVFFFFFVASRMNSGDLS